MKPEELERIVISGGGMSKKKKRIDSGQKKQLLEHARDVITEFNKGVVMDDDPNPHDWGEYGVTLFEGYSVRFTNDYLKARREFTGLAAKILKAKSAHEKTIRTLCQKAGQEYVKLTAPIDQSIPDALNDAAKALVDTVLAEAGREYVHIEPNFLVRHEVPDVVTLGRVRSMRTELAATNTPLSKTSRVMLMVGAYPKQSFHEGGTTSLCMPSSVWVVDLHAKQRLGSRCPRDQRERRGRSQVADRRGGEPSAAQREKVAGAFPQDGRSGGAPDLSDDSCSTACDDGR